MRRNSIIEEQKIQISFLKALWYCVIWLLIPFGIVLVLAILFAIFSATSSAPVNIESLLGNSYIEMALSYLSVYLAITIIIRNKWSKLQLNFKGIANKYWVLGTVFFAIGLHIIVSEVDNIVQLIFPMTPYWQEVFEGLSDLPIGIYILLVVVTAPVVEELFMRGLIAKGMANKYSKKKAIVLTALLFGAIHLNIWQFTSAFVGGLFITWLFLTTDALLLAILAHAVHNGIGIVVSYVFNLKIPGYNIVYETTKHQPVWFTVIGVLLIIIGVYIFKKANNKKHLDSDNSFIIE